MKSRMSGVAHVTGEVVDFKELTTESGKKLAHLQIENADGRTWVLVPAKVYRRAEGLIERGFRDSCRSVAQFRESLPKAAI